MAGEPERDRGLREESRSVLSTTDVCLPIPWRRDNSGSRAVQTRFSDELVFLFPQISFV